MQASAECGSFPLQVRFTQYRRLSSWNAPDTVTCLSIEPLARSGKLPSAAEVQFTIGGLAGPVGVDALSNLHESMPCFAEGIGS